MAICGVLLRTTDECVQKKVKCVSVKDKPLFSAVRKARVVNTVTMFKMKGETKRHRQ